MIYRNYSERSAEIIDLIPKLRQAKGVGLRTDIHANRESLSSYSYIKYLDYPKDLKAELDLTFGRDIMKGLVASNVLHLDIGQRLDRTDHWMYRDAPFSFLSLALHDNQKIIVNDEEFILDKGDAIWFKPDGGTHEIKPVDSPNTWVVLVVGDYLKKHLD